MKKIFVMMFALALGTGAASAQEVTNTENVETTEQTQAVSLCKEQYDKWWVALILGLVTIGFGALLVFRPFAAPDTVVTLIGVFLIYDGVSDLWIVSRVARTAKILRQEARAVDVEAEEID